MKCEMKAGRIAAIVLGVIFGAGFLGVSAACNSKSVYRLHNP